MQQLAFTSDSLPRLAARALAIAAAAGALASVAQVAAASPATAPPYEALEVADRGDSLSDLLDRIQTELVAQGAVAWEGFAHDSNPQPGYQADWTYQKRAEATAFHYDLANCDFDYNFKVTVDGSVTTDGDAGVPLKSLISIQVADLADLIRIRDAQAGHPTYSSHLQPAIYAVEAIRGDGQFNEFDFYSLETARRVARLLERAASACGANPVVRE
jgi:hypothetical protein